MDGLNLDQLYVFVAAADQGSFSGASRRLNRAQSAITYAIKRLEHQIGAALFDRDAYRPSLTDTGRALLPRARRILADVAQFRSAAHDMAGGIEAEVRLGIADMVLIDPLVPALAAFHADFPTVALRIMTGSFGVSRALIDGLLDVAITVDLGLPDTLDRKHLGHINLIPVAAPVHPLAALAGPLGTEVLRDHLQIVLTQLAPASGGPDYGVTAINSWRTTDLATKHTLLRAGIGWGSMPEPIVANDIAEGRLVALRVDRWDGSDQLPQLTVAATSRRDRPPGVAGRALLAQIVSHQIRSPLGSEPVETAKLECDNGEGEGATLSGPS